MSEYQLAPQAIEDLFDIWCYIADDSPRAANAVEEAILNACVLMANSPLSFVIPSEARNPLTVSLSALVKVLL